jgi:mitogen-activated protein kinase-activated protein kinase 2
LQPFYSFSGKPISPGMKKRIKNGEFQFPPKEWSKVSSEAKILIVGMLETKPEKRLTINEILNDEWIKVID